MSSEVLFQTLALSELGEFKNGANFSQDDYGAGYPIVNVKQLYGGRYIDLHGLESLGKDVLKRPAQLFIEAGDILFARSSVKRSGAGQCALVPHGVVQTIFSGFIIRYRLNDKSATNPMFLAYLLQSPIYREIFPRIATGTTISNLSQEALKQIQVTLPDERTQNEVAVILGALDDRIALLRDTNATLEAIAQALFKSWFVDFDPVRAKMEGRVPEGMDEATAALFPDGFEESELGLVPRGCRVTKLEGWLSVLETGRRPKGGVSGILDGVPSIGAESIFRIGQFDYRKTKYVPDDFFTKMNSGALESHDVLLYKDGGKPGVFLPRVSMFGDGFPFKKCGINEHVFRIRIKAPFNQPFLYFWLWSDAVMHELKHRGGKAAIPGINQSDVKDQKISVPSDAVLMRFGELVAPMVSKIFNNAKSCQTLAILRDTLLPRLISGQLRLPEAEALLEEACA
uniref:Type I restriction endonuclease S subunit n=1 Tax=Polaromonas sp. H8N TaxID=1840297 RepID=A0A2S1FIG3_9BURK|nr:restriction endonuclease subunit S [Polaromonas sp. H8N]AWD72304.1 type I restriction endonuclease S subunit [Polaromonas sp. H8N]